jgi:hypothetical protein
VAERAPDGEVPAVSPAALPRDARAARPAEAGSGAEPPARRGFFAALRTAAGPVELRGDLRAFPSILLRSKAGWLPAIVIVVTAGAMMTPEFAANEFVALAGNVILQPPPMIIAFLAGMLAPRAAWLMGGLMSLVSGAAFVLVVAVTTESLITPLGFTYQVPADQKMAYAVNVLTTSPVFGIAIGAFAGFYRRFLYMSAARRPAARGR